MIQNLNKGQDVIYSGPLYKKEITGLLGVSMHTANLWLNAIADRLGEPVGRVYSIRQVNIIIDEYGSKCAYADRQEEKKEAGETPD